MTLSMLDVVDSYVDLLHEERAPDGMWDPSSVSGCTRRAVYTVRGVVPSDPHSQATRRRFRIGHLLHAFVGDALATSPDVLHVYPEFEIESAIESGHGDALVELEDGTFIVVEAKSSRDPHPKLDPRHAKQGAHYAVHARTRGYRSDDGWSPPLGDRLTGVLVVYFGKVALDVTEYWLPYDETWETRLADRLAHLETYRADPESLPPRQMNAKGGKSRECWEGCPFVTRCWATDPASLPAR